ncbi:MAG: ribonuclease H family protein [Lachnospiraceae bacterium]|nr:ribonuclease H family protein [Lachnospiraceae bacterium]
MAKKFYAVRAGRQPGIYESWEECRRQITGFSGAAFKGFATREEAEAFIAGTENERSLEDTEAIAYVDGSFDVTTGSFSYGMVLFYEGKELHFSEKYEDSALADMRNVAGEIKGAEAAMRYCIEHDIASISIYHDYEGIAKWCTGEWQAKKEGTAAYANYYKAVSKSVEVRFVKVKGHSGDKYNDLADELAKKALGIS